MLCKTNIPLNNKWYCVVFYMFKRSIYPIHKCVFTVCVGRSSEFNWRWTRPITWASSWTCLPPLSPPLPLHILVFRAQTSTQISIHSLSASSSMERGERRVRKDRAYQIVLALRLLFVDVMFFFLLHSLRKAEADKKGHLANSKWEQERRKEKGRGEEKLQPR